MAQQTIAAGYKYLWYGLRDSNGIFIGSSTTAPTAGDANGSGMTRLLGARTIPIPLPDPVTLVVSGDDEPMVSFQFDPEALPSGVFEQAQRDNAFEALAQGTLVETVGSLEISQVDPVNRSAVSMCMLLSRRAKSVKSGSYGAHRWESIFIPSVTIKPLEPANITQREFGPYRYFMNLSRSDRTAWSTISNALHGTTGSTFQILDSDNPLHVQRFTGNAAATAWVVDYPPVSAARTHIYFDDVRQAAPASVSGTTVNAAGAAGSGAVVVILYEVAEDDLNA